MFLKYALIHERQCLQALVSPEFVPFCLKSTGLSLNALSRALPSARYTADDLNQPQDFQATVSTSSHARLRRSSSIQADEYRHTEEIDAATFADSLSHERGSSLPGSVEVAIEHPLAHSSSETSEIVDEDDASEVAHGGETLQVELPDVVMADFPGSHKKHHNPIQRGISKIINVATGRSKARKARSSSEGTPVVSQSSAPSKKRLLKYEESVFSLGNSSGVDEAWFKLACPEDVVLPNLTPGRWRIMSEANLLASVLSVYCNNETLMTTGAYVVRKLCFLESADMLDDVSSIRCRLANTSLVSVLLEALRQFKKNHQTVSTILVALGNLAISRVLATQIGDRGLSLIVASMSLHRSRPKVIEYGTFLLLNVCDSRVEYKRKLRSLGMPQLVVKILDKFVSSLRPDHHHPAVIAAEGGPTSATFTESQKSPRDVASEKSEKSDKPHHHRHHHHTVTNSSGSHASSSSAPSTGASASSHPTWKEKLFNSVQPAIDLHEFLNDIQLQSENEGGDSPRSRGHVGGSGGSSEAELSTAETDEEESYGDDDSSEASAEEESATGEDEKDEKACKWMYKRRPHFAQLQADFCHRRAPELTMMKRLLDLMSVLGSEYDILKPELALKTATLLGDMTISLFGCPWPHVDALLTSAFRTLVVIFEWDTQSRDWRYNLKLVRSLTILSRMFVRAHVPLRYSSSCNLVIFSIIWKKWDQDVMRKRLINLIVASLRLEMSFKSGRGDSMRLASSASSSAPSDAKSGASAQNHTRSRSVVIPSAAMLGDMAHAFYDLRGYIRDTGVLQVLRALRDDEALFEEAERDRISDILDEFEDNPLLRGRHRQRQAMMQQMQQLQQQQQAAPDAAAPIASANDALPVQAQA